MAARPAQAAAKRFMGAIIAENEPFSKGPREHPPQKMGTFLFNKWGRFYLFFSYMNAR
jgi:hypothetical protein